MASDSSSGLFSFPTEGITHFFTATQIKPERVEEKEQTNKHALGSAPSARKGVCDTLHSPCICSLSWACILRETSTKATRNANSSLSSLTTSFCWPSFPWTAISRRLLSSAHRCQLLSLFAVGPSSLLYFRSRGRSRAQALCLDFAPKRFFDRRAHAHTQHNEWPNSVTSVSGLYIHQLVTSDIVKY